ncbi:MAG: alpha/beta hydrolase [Vulcanimicrobiaceae bacterium]
MRTPLAAVALALSLIGGTSGRASAAVLPPAPTPAESFDVGTLHVDRYGSGDPIVLVPGLACGAWVWNGIIPHLAATHAVYALTLAGFAGRPPQGTPSFGGFVRDLTALLDQRHLARIVLVGHNLGGTLAIAYAEEYSNRLRGVVAIDGVPIFPDTDDLTPAQRQVVASRLASTLRAKTPEQMIAFETGLMSAGGVSDPTLAAPLAALTAQSDPTTVAEWLTADVEVDLRPRLGAITVPLDEIVPYDPSEANPVSAVHPTEAEKRAAYVASLARVHTVDVVTISPAKLFVMIDQPDRFTTALDMFLARL